MKNVFDTIDSKQLDNTTGGGPVGDAIGDTIGKTTGPNVPDGFPFPRKPDKQRPKCIVCGLG
jgi:hypothetical protein